MRLSWSSTIRREPARNNEVRTWARVIGTSPSARWLDKKIGAELSIDVTNSRNALDLALAGVAPTFFGQCSNRLKQVTAPINTLDRVIERTHAVLRAVIK